MSIQTIPTHHGQQSLYYAKLVNLPAYRPQNNDNTYWSHRIQPTDPTTTHKKYSIDSNLNKSYFITKQYSREDVESPIQNQQQQQQTSPSTLMSKLSNLMNRTRKSTNDLLNSRSISFSSSSTSTSSSPIASNSPNLSTTKRSNNIANSIDDTCEWSFDENDNYWSNKNKLTIKLISINIRNLTIFEINCLKQICHQKIQQNLQLNIQIPKDESIKSIKQSHFTLRSKSVVYKLAFSDDIKFLKDESNSCVFGQSLHKCILNDMRKQRNDKLKLSLECCDLATITSTPYTQIQHHQQQSSKRNSVLYEALDLSSIIVNKQQQQQHEFNQRDYIESLISFKNDYYVPDIVKQCCLHIEKYGLNTVGIFRIDSSKKRIKEIKEIFDSGQMIILDNRYNPLDVACLLKDYLRTLPDPLLTRKLYSAFIYASKLKDNIDKLELVRNLICLLPVANRDTLQLILQLLDKLTSHCTIEMSSKQKTGNKMDSFNLAMIFGPNLLQKHRQNKDIYSIDKYSLVDDIESVISITKFLIENQSNLFIIDDKLHNQVLKKVNELNPNELDVILRKKYTNSIGVTQIDSDSCTTDSSGYCSVNTRSTSTTDDTSSTKSDLCHDSTEFYIDNNNKIQTSAFQTIQSTKHKNHQRKSTGASRQNVYIKNRAYFPISHMDKKLIYNLNEENNKFLTNNNNNSTLLMISNKMNNCNQMKTKSLTNLNQCNIHFVGEQETLV